MHRLSPVLSLVLVLVASSLPVAAQVSAVRERGRPADAAIREAWLAKDPDRKGLDVLLVTLSSVQPERIAAGGADSATPNLDRFSREAVVFEEAFAVSPHPLVGLHALLCGQAPSALAAARAVSAGTLLTEEFERGGHRAWCFATKRLLETDSLEIGPQRGDFGVTGSWWEYGSGTDKLGALVDRVDGARLESLRTFGWVHLPFCDPPANYHPGITSGSRPEDHYRASLTLIDRAVGELLGGLEADGRADRTIVVVVGTCGLPAPRAERVDPDPRVDDRALRVPLMIRVPGVAARRVKGPVDTLDVGATLTDLAFGTVPATSMGRSLASCVLGAVEAPGTAIAEILDPEGEAAARSLRTSDARLLRAAGTTTVFARTAEGAWIETDDVARARRLLGVLDGFLAYRDEALRGWRDDPAARPPVEGANLDVARARILADRDPAAARSIAMGTIGTGEEDAICGALRLLARVATSEDAASLRPLLSHRRPRVAALAGAVMVAIGATDEGIDLATSGYAGLTSLSDRLAFISALGRSRDEAAGRALRAIEIGPGEDRLLAARTLALAEQGDEAALRDLVRIVLDPHLSVDRPGAIRALVNARGAQAVGVLDLFVSHLAHDDAGMLVAIDALRRLDGREAAAGLAAAIAKASPRVSRRASALLREWDSPAAVPVLAGLAMRNDRRTPVVLRELLSYPHLVGSPVLPGRLADSAGEDFGWTDRVVRFDSPAAGASRIAVLFRPREDEGLGAESVTFQARLNSADDPIDTAVLDAAPTAWVWAGDTVADGLRRDSNSLAVRFAATGRRGSEARLLAILALPEGAVQATRPLIGFRADGPHRARGRLSPDASRVWLWARVDRAAKGAIILYRGETALGRIDFDGSFQSASVEVAFRRRPRPGEEYHLVWEGPVGVTADALVYSRR
ncbi:MAG: sulfatase-like hydrolase/transferase [Planctomycetota bacterium]